MERIRTYMAAAGIALSDTQLSQLETYYRMVVEKNQVMNLTAITQRDEFILKHLIDSVAPLTVKELQRLFPINAGPYGTAPGVAVTDAPGSATDAPGSATDTPGSATGAPGSATGAVPSSDRIRLIDVGTGAGFPGIPLKILCPALSVTLLDSLQKRVGFLQEVIDALGLKDITAVHMRAEEGGQDPALREKFDLAVSRAVANLSMLAEYDLPFVRTGGCFLAYKSGDVTDELRSAGHAIRVLGGHYEEPVFITLPNSDIRRAFVQIRKEKPTPKQYPRKAGTAKRNPL